MRSTAATSPVLLDSPHRGHRRPSAGRPSFAGAAGGESRALIVTGVLWLTSRPTTTAAETVIVEQSRGEVLFGTTGAGAGEDVTLLIRDGQQLRAGQSIRTGNDDSFAVLRASGQHPTLPRRDDGAAACSGGRARHRRSSRLRAGGATRRRPRSADGPRYAARRSSRRQRSLQLL